MHRSFYVPQAAQGPVPWQPLASPRPARRLVARQLRRAGAWLAWAARQVAAPTPRQLVQPSWPELEFHAEAGAPEGALYVNGEYVGRLDVNRL